MKYIIIFSNNIKLFIGKSTNSSINRNIARSGSYKIAILFMAFENRYVRSAVFML